MAEVDYNFDGRTEADIFLSFKAAKGHRTRNFNKITNLLALQEAKYSRFTENTLLAAVKEMERQMDKLVLLAGYLQIHRLTFTAAHVTEANNLLTATEEQADLVMKQIHAHEPAAGQDAAWAQAQGVIVSNATAKPVMT